ncbi:MAG TPA: hypothetical protein VIW29_11520 [Polyangiaceae bacterium]
MRSWLGLGLEPNALLVELLGFGCVLLCAAIALSPVLRDLSTYGGHDWDEMSAHRLLTVKALLQYGQLPLWMPYACGGYSEWGNVQGATNLVSPFLPAYLLLELRHALRVELYGTVLIASLGTWLLAGRFTRSVPARTLACLLFVTNGRFALQAATGHLWHLQYCYLPWAFWAYEGLLAGERVRLRWLVAGGGALALLVYSGGIYPLPHTALLLGAYACARVVSDRSWRPATRLVLLALCAVGLAAPKLFAVALDFGERPRLVPSTEAIGLDVLWQALTAREQTPGSRPAATPRWGWHEYGMYIGVVPALMLALGLGWPAPRRELALRFSGLLALLLGFGAFHDLAPWTLLHRLPVFDSQHVPTRWLYPALLLLGVTLAAVVGRSLEQAVRRLAWGPGGQLRLELALLAGCLLLAVDIGREASFPLEHAFWMKPRAVAAAREFVQYERPPPPLQYRRRDYAPEALPAMLAGVGVLQCTLHASLNIWAPQAADSRPIGMGAWGNESPRYRGEAYTASGVGTAQIVAFSPSRVEVEVQGVRAGERVILNQNFDPGWRVNGRASEPFENAISTRLTAPSERLSFVFRPRGLHTGLWALGLTLALLGAWAAYRRRASAATLSP